MAASAGKGRALTGVIGRDHSGLDKLYRTAQWRDAEQKKKRKEKDDAFAKMSDFKIDYSGVLPMYAKAMTGIQTDFINEMAELKQSDSPNAQTQAWKRFTETKAELEQLQYNNDKAMEYLAMDQAKFYVEDEIARMLTNPNGTLADLEPYNDGVYFQTSPTGVFNAMPIAKANRDPYTKFAKQDYDTYAGTKAKDTETKGKKIMTKTHKVTDATLDERVGRANQDPILQQEQLYRLYWDEGVIPQGNTPEEYGQDAYRLVSEANKRMVYGARPSTKYEQGYYTEPQGSGDEAPSMGLQEALASGKVTANAKEYRKVPEEKRKKYKKEIPASVRAQGTEMMPDYIDAKTPPQEEAELVYAQDLPNAKNVTITTNSEIYNYNTGKQVDFTEMFDFKPGSLFVDDLGDGVVRAYVRGKTVYDPENRPSGQEQEDAGTASIAPPEEKGKPRDKETQYEFAIPVQYVYNAIAVKNDMTWLKEALMEKRAQNLNVEFPFGEPKPDANWE